MAVVSVIGAKGGSGASLIAVNLAVLLAKHGGCILLDLHPSLGIDDLLLDLNAERSWLDLLPVADELCEQHLELTAVRHASGLRLLAGGDGNSPALDQDRLGILIRALEERTAWLLLDLPSECVHVSAPALFLSQALLIVTTPDPPALRTTHRLVDHLARDLRRRSGLVINQWTKQHPVHPQEVAYALGLPLLGILPLDGRAVAQQVNFGRSCVEDQRSIFGRGVFALSRRLDAAVRRFRGGGGEAESLEHAGGELSAAGESS